MKILVTGASGFVGKNLCSRLNFKENIEVVTFNSNDSIDTLNQHTKDCDLVFHLAGSNRVKHVDEFYQGNVDALSVLINSLELNNNIVPIVLTSSIQAELDNDYGKSKKAGEDILNAYSKKYQKQVYIYRLPNLFGKWSRPFYNSVVATWSHQISRGEEVEISDKNHQLTLVYIDDLVDEFIKVIHNQASHVVDNYYHVLVNYQITLENLYKIIKSFKESRNNLLVPNMSNDLEKKLYSTYLNYLDKDDFKYQLKTFQDERGSFSEFLKSKSSGQVSVNVSTAYQIKGNHFHHSKNEKFLVVKGKAKIKFRDVYSEKVIEYVVSDKKFEVVDIPTGYTHNIINLLDQDLVTIMWVNEIYDPNNPDTYYLEVEV